MEDSEGTLLFFFGVASLLVWGHWWTSIYAATPLRRLGTVRLILSTAPLLGVLVVLATLSELADEYVRGSFEYKLFYLFLGMAWVGGFRYGMRAVGLFWDHDALDRRNIAAALAAAGAIVGLFLAYCGANIGDGPGWWVVVPCAFLSTATLYLTWAAAEMVTRVTECVTIDRDTGAGVHLGLFLVALGILYGKSVAGNWISLGATILDFIRDAWVGVLLLGVFIQMEIMTRPRGNSNTRSVSVALMAGLVYIAAAVGYSIWSGW